MTDINLYGKLNVTTHDSNYPTYKKVVETDPAQYYAMVKINKFERKQKFYVSDLFPTPEDKTCACGCGNKLTGRSTRWYESGHDKVPVAIFKVMTGDLQVIKGIMMTYLPYECSQCRRGPYTIETEKKYRLFNGETGVRYHWSSGIQVDHILAVKNGGGGCWLGNYQFLCHTCHRIKTTQDNAYRNRSGQLPLSNEFY